MSKYILPANLKINADRTDGITDPVQIDHEVLDPQIPTITLQSFNLTLIDDDITPLPSPILTSTKKKKRRRL
jgi:hypothetical protein